VATPLTSAKRKRILALHAEGKGRNDIAREAGVSAASVSKIIAEAGLSFDRTATKARDRGEEGRLPRLVALQRHMDLERHDADEKAANAKSMLLELGRALGVQQPDQAA
jgi:hypothetical protein